MASSFKDDPDYLGPISATPQKMVETMLSMAGVTATDVVFDLGCNDARVLVTAASTAGARGVGVEIDEAYIHVFARVVDPVFVAGAAKTRTRGDPSMIIAFGSRLAFLKWAP
jgi:predicted RNA methylase